MIIEACQTLKRNRERYLASRPLQVVIRLLARVGENWLEPADFFRQKVLAEGPAQTGFSSEVIAAGLDDFFRQLTADNLHALITQDLGHRQRLEKMVATDADQKSRRLALARGPVLLGHVTARTLPCSTLASMVLGFLVRSAQFVKCARHSSFIPRMFAHSIYHEEPKLGACLEVAEWKGGTAALDAALIGETDCLTASGSDETLAAIRQLVPPRSRFIGYGHKVSFGFVAREALAGRQAKKIAERAARDVAAWNQLGCLSPHVFYVETGGDSSPEQFAELLATELQARETSHPRGHVGSEEAAAISYRRSFYQVRAGGGAEVETRLWQSEQSTAWTVIFESDARFQLSCLNRFVYVKPVSSLKEALDGADAVLGKVSTVGLASDSERAEELANALAQWGVTRICPVGEMQNPTLLWRHDGRPSLGELVTWTDWET